ncbi:SH3 domain protein [Trichinella nativa]|uniref:SH3 domain protein n=1 Tax=Trichinella nativa TaxID=6335 RepID=A0A1Y3EMS3_9BILA|nr:SH3 domain protein [Trichinella nativa]
MAADHEEEDENSFAEALYDNNAEWPDELTFRRGDVLKVLERNPAKGLAQGWWLCFDPSTGKTGIAPSNRLKSMDRPPSSSQSRVSSDDSDNRKNNTWDVICP